MANYTNTDFGACNFFGSKKLVFIKISLACFLFLLTVFSGFTQESEVQLKIGYGFPMFKNQLSDVQSLEADYSVFYIQTVSERTYHSFGQGVNTELSYSYVTPKNLILGVSGQYLQSKSVVVNADVTLGFDNYSNEYLHTNKIISLLPYVGYQWVGGVVSPYVRAGLNLNFIVLRTQVTNQLPDNEQEILKWAYQKRNPVLGLYNAVGINFQEFNSWKMSIELFGHFVQYKPKFKKTIEYEATDGTTLFELDLTRKETDYVDEVSANLIVDEQGNVIAADEKTSLQNKELQPVFSMHSVGFKIGIARTFGGSR